MNYKNDTMIDPTLDELFTNNILPRRGLLVCKKSEIFYLSELIECYDDRFQFILLRTCGKGANTMLMAVYERYKHFKFVKSADRLENHFSIELQSLSDAKRCKLEDQVENFILEMSTRAKNVLFNVATLLKEPKLLHIILDEKQYFHRFRNAGPKTIPELETLRLKTTKFLIELKSQPEE